jgi:hypothetical protein
MTTQAEGLHRFGRLVPHLAAHVPQLRLRPGEVLVRDHTTQVPPSDRYREESPNGHVPLSLPSIPASTASGVVEAVADDVQDFAPGDPVAPPLAKSTGAGPVAITNGRHPRDASAGQVASTSGEYSNSEVKAGITAAVQDISSRRAIIEQAKGMLMLLHDIEDQAAFDLLRWRSQAANVKLRDLAVEVVKEFRRLGSGTLAPKIDYDKALMNAHITISTMKPGR